MSSTRSGIKKFQEFINEYKELQKKRCEDRIDTDTFRPKELERKKAEEIENKHKQKIKEFSKNASTLMFDALNEVDEKEFENKVQSILSNGGLIAVKKISNPIKGNLLETFEKILPVTPSTHRGDPAAIESDGENEATYAYFRNILYYPDVHRVVIRPIDSKRCTPKDEKYIFTKKSPFTAIGIPTANITLFDAHYLETPFCMIIDPQLTYLSNRFTFEGNASTSQRWWHGGSSYDFDIQFGIPERLKPDNREGTTTLTDIQAQQEKNMGEGKISVQNEILPKIPLIAILGNMVPQIESKNPEDILINRFASLYANFTWRNYCVTHFPKYINLWSKFPIHLHQPVLGLRDKKEAYQAEKLGIQLYTTADQVTDFKSALTKMDNVLLEKWVVKITKLVETCPTGLIPSEITDVLKLFLDSGKKIGNRFT